MVTDGYISSINWGHSPHLWPFFEPGENDQWIASLEIALLSRV